MNRPYKAISAAALLLSMSGQAFAACTSSVYHPGGYSGDIGTVTVTDINAAVGSPLTGWRDFPSVSQGTKRVSWYCDSGTNVKFSAQGTAGAVSTYNDGSRSYSVYPTGMPGIGIVFRTHGDTGVGSHNIVTGILSNTTQRTYSQTNPAASNRTYAYEINYRLIKTGAISSGGIVPRVIARTWWEPTPSHFNPREYNILLGRGTIIAPVPTCNLATSDLDRTIRLDPVRISNFTGISTGLKYFDLTANCSNASSVTFRFTGTPAPGNAALFANTDTARGVALWLHTPGQTVSHNSTRTVAVSANRAVLRLGAEYHKTTGPLTQGKLASAVTVNITYN
ncbi:fimbrial protein [Pseudomonas batumici]|uniref:fimbrial protein n=1 Tax=Pseudomonas batumici TaxID=226910 RepID=UPI001FD804CB|nr:fimbrial protein [Pseudomonas batumici]